MIVPERVAAFLTQVTGNAYCDDCIQEKLKLARRQQAQQATSALGASGRFQREMARCSGCGGEKMVTRLTGGERS
jgi:hypothetical protein